jgi:hypothetical protein
MLSRKTLGVAGAAMLGTMALMATNVANALIVAGGDGTHADAKFAKEALTDTTGTTHTKNSTKYYLVGNTGTVLHITGETIIAPTEDVPIFLRFELENMVFGSVIADASAGGGVGDNFVVMRYEAGSGSVGRVIEPTSLGVMPGMPGSVAVTAHASALDAFRDTNAVDTEPQMAENAVMVVDGIVETGTSSTTVAEVATGFTKFVSPGGGAISTTLAAIGKLEIKTAMSVLARNGSPAATPSVLLNSTDPITVTYMGDFSEHTYTLNSAMACTGDVLVSSVNSDKTELTLATQPDGSTATETQYLCVSVAEDNMMRITDAAFTATVKYAAVENAAFPRMEMTETVGMIDRNGTTVHIPYMTTFDGYNQRIVLSNRSSTEALYEISFRPEMGVTATPTDMATGTLMGNSTVTYKATDLVMLEGGSRTAATIDVVARPDDIDVSSVIVNKDGGGTDTVVHHSMN